MSDKPRLKRDWEGRYVRIRYDMETNGGTIFKAGEVLRVTRNHGGLYLKGLRKCPCCESMYRRRTIVKVPERDVDLLPLSYTPLDETPVMCVDPYIRKLEKQLERAALELAARNAYLREIGIDPSRFKVED